MASATAASRFGRVARLVAEIANGDTLSLMDASNLVELPAEFQAIVNKLEGMARHHVQDCFAEMAGRGITSSANLISSLPTLQGAVSSAAHVLPYFGEAIALAPLLRMVSNPDRRTRFEALRPLARLETAGAIEKVIEVMQSDSDPKVRTQAAHALTFANGDFQVLERLLDVFRNVDEIHYVRAQAAEGLGMHLRHSDRRTRVFKQAQQSLISGLSESDVDIRFWSCYALAQMGSTAALPELLRLAESDNEMCPGWWPVCDEASDAISSINGKYDKPERKMIPVTLPDARQIAGWSLESYPDFL
jgi:HEAT repeat protein